MASDADEQGGLFDLKETLERVDGDLDLLRELRDIFLEDAPQTVGEIRAAIRAGDGPMLTKSAHSLKGSVGNFSTASVFEAAQELELMGREGDLAEAAEMLAVLERELDRLIGALKEI